MLKRSSLKMLLLFILLVGLSLSGCARTSSGPSSAEETSPDSLKESEIQMPPRSEDQGILYSGNISEGRTSGPMLPVYFKYDSYNIKEDMLQRMETNAMFLKDNPHVLIEIQGNCDERGTVEYNLALGEKRAKSAKKYLVNLGINPKRIDIVSFGKELPLDPGRNEAAWAKNRRADFVIIKAK